jgi:hypothetical protein
MDENKEETKFWMLDVEEALLIGIYVDLDRQRFLLTKQILKLIRSNFIKE